VSNGAWPFVPGRLAGVDKVVLDTAFPRHLAVLGEPYLRAVIGSVLHGTGRIPPAVKMELTKAKRYAPSVLVLLPPRGLLMAVALTGQQTEEAAALAAVLPVKSGGMGENLGEAQAIVAAQALNSPLVIDDGDGIRAALGRRINVVLGIHLIQHAALEGFVSDDDGWDIWRRVCSPGVGFKPSTAITRWDTCADCQATFRASIASAR
jgi:hypothetical protein